MASPLFNINTQSKNQGTGKIYSGNSAAWSTNYKKAAVQNTVAAINNSYNKASYYLSNSIGDEETSYKNARVELDNLKKNLNVLENLRSYISEDILPGADYDSIVSQAASSYDELMGKYTRDYASFRNLAGSGNTPFKLTSGIAKGYEIPDMETKEVAAPTIGERISNSWLGNTTEAVWKGFWGQLASGTIPTVKGLQKATGTSGFSAQAEYDLERLRQERDSVIGYLGEDNAYVLQLNDAIANLEQEMGILTDENAFQTRQEERYTSWADRVAALNNEADIASARAVQQGENALGIAGRWLTQGAISATQQMADVAIGGGMPAMVARMYGAGVQEGIENGYDTAGQIGMGIKAASITYLTEKLFGGNPFMDEAGVGLVNRAAKALGANQKLISFMNSAPAEIVEEGLEEVLESVANWAVNKVSGANTDDFTLQSVVDDFVVGMLVSGIGKTIGLADTVQQNAWYENVYGGAEADLVAESLDIDPENAFAQKMQNRLDDGKSLRGGQLRKLVQQNEAVLNSEEYRAMLEAAGVTEESEGAATFAATENAAETTVGAPASENGYTASESGKAELKSDGTEVEIEGVASTDGGTMTLLLSNGTEVNAGDINFATEGEAFVYDAVASLDVSPAVANSLIDAWKDDTAGVAARDYALGVVDSFRYGSNNMPKAQLEASRFASKLTALQRNNAYVLGQHFSGKQVATAEAIARRGRIANKFKTASSVTSYGGGKVVLEGVDESTFTERQKASVSALETVADALGVSFHLFESDVDASGKRVGANGWYVPGKGEIHIDVKAGSQGQDTILFTASHELTHFIKDWSPAKFKKLSNFLMQEYGESDVTVEELVQRQIEKAKRNGRDIDFDTAFEEVVADSMETMLADGNVVEKLAKLKAEDRTLWEKIRDFIRDLAEKIKKVYDGLTPDSAEGRYVAEMKDKLEEFQNLFTEGLAAAGENFQAAAEMGIAIDTETESVAPIPMMSERTWTESEYVTARDAAAKEIAEAIGVSVKKAKAYIDDINSIAAMIAADRTRLDYFSSPGRSSFVGNVEYGGSFDFSTLCKKRLLLTGTFTAIQKALPNTALTADEILDIRNRMKNAGLEVNCGMCYVEGSRAKMGEFSKEFLRLYKEYYPDAWQPNMVDVNTPDGVEAMRLEHPEAYEQYEYFWNHYGKLRDSDPNLFASQQKPKLYQLHTEYNGEILKKFKGEESIEDKNRNGGIRMQSFSDFEIVHLIDMMQIIMDMSRVGLAGQAYTKVPDFAWALGDTGLKINLSLVAKDVDGNGQLIFDGVEGMDIDTAMALRDRYSKNVGTIVVVFTDKQLTAAMADERVDFIIPFHRSQWKKSQYGAMGLPANTKDYTYQQNEKYIKPQYHEYRGRMVKDKATNYMPNEYWDFSKNGKENAEAYLEMCARNNKRPKFYKLLTDNRDGSYSLKADGSTDGYWKLLIDFKMYDNDGIGSPQTAVRPAFNMEEARRMLDEYKGGHQQFPVARGIVDEFVSEYKATHKPQDGVKYSERETESLSNRSLLANAFEGLAQNDVEKAKMAEYKENIAAINEQERILHETNAEIRKLSFGTGTRDQARLRALRDEAAKAANRIDTYDRKLLRLEASKPLQNVLERAKDKAYKKAKAEGKKALEAYREKAEARQQEISERYRESKKRTAEQRKENEAIRKYRERIKKDVDELTEWILRPNNKTVTKHVPEILKTTVTEFIETIDFSSKRALRGGEATKADRQFIQRMTAVRKAIETSADGGDLYSGYLDLPEGFTGRLQDFIDTAQRIVNTGEDEYVINRMSSAQLQELSKIVRSLKTFIKQMNVFHANAMYQHVYEAADETIDSLGRMQDAGKNANAASNYLLWKNIRPAYAFERFGKGGEAIYDGLRRGQAQLAFNSREIIDFAEATYTAKEVKSWEEKTVEISLGSGESIRMPVANIMSLYKLKDRPQALRHILGEGVRVATYKDGKEVVRDAGHKLTEGDVDRMVAALTPRQKQVADKLQQFMAQRGGEWGNHVSVARFGEKLFGEKDYFPIHSDGRHLQADAGDAMEAASLYRLLNMSFTKEVNEKANNRLVLYSIFDVFANHMSSMAQYNAMALPVLDALKWFNYRQKDPVTGEKLNSVRDEMNRVYGAPVEDTVGRGEQGYAEHFVANVLKAFNGTEAQGSANDSIGLKLLSGYNKAAVAANLRVAIQQPTAIIRAGLLVDMKNVVKGLGHSAVAIRKNIEEMQKYSGIAAWKDLGFYDVNISRGVTDMIKHKTNASDWITEKGLWLAEKADKVTWAAIWNACKIEVRQKQGIRLSDPGFYEATAKLFEDVIYKTQVVDSVLTKSEYMRDRGFWARMTSSFMSEPVTTASMVFNAYDKYSADIQRGNSRQEAWKKNGKLIARTAYVYALGGVINATAQAVADAFRDDDDYEKWLEKFMAAFRENLVGEMNLLDNIPVVADAWESLVYGVSYAVNKAFGTDIYANVPQLPLAQMGEQLSKATEIFTDKISGKDTNYTVYGGVYKMLQFLSGLTGLPAASLTREVITLWNNTVGALTPGKKVKTYQLAPKAEIKYAFLDGFLTEEEATAELLAKDLAEDANEAYFTIREWEAGDGYSRYGRIYDAVQTGEGFDEALEELTSHGYAEKDVISQVKSEIGKWYKEGTVTKDEASQMLADYTGMEEDEIDETVTEWSCVVETGIAYGDMKEAFMNGDITRQEAISYRAKYGGYSTGEATQDVSEWAFEKDHGFAYGERIDQFKQGNLSASELLKVTQSISGKTEDDAKTSLSGYIRDGYEEGAFSRGEAASMLTGYAGLTEESAEMKLTYIDVKKQYPDAEMDESWVSAYYAEIESSGIDIGTYLEYRTQVKSITGTGKKERRMAVIDTLPITDDQKTALYYSEGWAASKLYEAPWMY